MAIIVPIIIIWVLCALLYLPPLQKYAIQKIENHIAQESDFRLSVGEVSLTFPLKITIKDFKLTKDEQTVAEGNAIAANISLLPLLRNEVEVNYILLEHATIDTHNLIAPTHIAGKVEHFRGVIRNIDLEKKNADIRQLHLNGADIKLCLAGDEEEADSTSAPIDWEIELYRSNIENTNISLQLPQDSTQIVAGIGKLLAKKLQARLSDDNYMLQSLQISKSSLSYDHGAATHRKAPLEHIFFKDINITGEEILYSPAALSAHIKEIELMQPDGININKGRLTVTADSTHVNIKQAEIESANGSFIRATATLPLTNTQEKRHNGIKAATTAQIDKRDLKGFLSTDQLSTIATLPDSLLSARIALSGSTDRVLIDTATIAIPTVATLHASGALANILDNKRKADILFNGTIYNPTPFTPKGDGETTATPLSIGGNATATDSTYIADVNISGKGSGNIQATYNTKREAYDIKVDFKQFDIESSIADVPVQKLTMHASLLGTGTNIFSRQTNYRLLATIDTLQSNDIVASDINLNAMQANSLSFISLISNSPQAKFNLNAESHIASTEIKNRTELNLRHFALNEMGLSNENINGSLQLIIEGRSDMNETHSMELISENITINTPQKRYTPADILLNIATAPDSSYIFTTNGDLHFKGTLASGYQHILAQAEKLQAMFQETRYSSRSIYSVNDFEKLLPATTINLHCGNQNMLYNFLETKGMNFSDMNIRCSIDSLKGIKAMGGMYNLYTTDTRLDTINFYATQEGENIKYFAGIRSSAITPEREKQSFRTALYGNLLRDTLNTTFTYKGNDYSSATRVEISTLLMPEGLNIHIQPRATILGEVLNINKDNYINIGKNEAISANVLATDKHNAGLHLYTVEDSTAKHDISLELFNVNLEKLTASLPFTPNMAGTLSSDIRLRNEAGGLVLSCDVIGDSIAYEGNYIGNETAEAVYLPKQDNNHIVSLQLYHDDNKYLDLKGDYNDNGNINGNATITKLPLKVMNAFIKGSDLNIDGYINGSLALNGPLESALSNGYIQFDSARVDAPLLGSQMHLVDNKVNIKDSKILFKNFDIYAKGDTPFKVNGEIDITRITRPTFNLKMQAKNYELINARQQQESLFYGKLFLDINALISGPIQSLDVNGHTTILGNTNVTYVMPETSINTNNELEGLVEFVNFSDTTRVLNTEDAFDFGNIAMSMTLNIEEGAWLNINFDSSRDNYINLQGGGQLNLNYTSEAGATLTGRYTLNSGEMRYKLDIIPLRTFSINPGSYINWTGDIMNPTLSLTALERIDVSVSMNDGNSQYVVFEAGPVIKNSLDNMELNFTIKAPENAAIQDELNSLDAETLNKYAITMLVMKAYLGYDDKVTMTNALTSLIDAKINDLAGDAMKNVNVNVGITEVEDKETGSSYTVYSFNLAKRFLNDRLTIAVGGKVNSGDAPEEDQSFINNISLEWKLTANGNRYLRIFYEKNYESILEGEVTEAGVGYVYRRKLNSLSELLYITRRDKKPHYPTDNNKEEEK